MEGGKNDVEGQHDGDFNSSDYTHNIDPSIGAANQEQQDDLVHEVENGNGEQRAATGVDGSGHIEHDSRAMEAVMQLAQAASQQHQYDEHPQDGNKGGSSKRRTSQGNSGSARPIKYARQDATSSNATGGDDSFQIPAAWSEGSIPAELQKVYQQHLASSAFSGSAAGTDSTADNQTDDNNKPLRQLSTSKRAAQNRAAQRAFRERRDKYVKVLEAKATRLEQAVRVATECKRRYVESLHTIDGLRQDNHTLRVALGALSGTPVGQPPQPMKMNEYLDNLPQIPPVTTEEEESMFPSAGGSLDSQGHAQNFGQQDNVSGQTQDGNPSLDSLSAVAAAAAAAAVRGDAAQPDDAQNGEIPSTPTADAGQTLPPVPSAASATATS